MFYLFSCGKPSKRKHNSSLFFLPPQPFFNENSSHSRRFSGKVENVENNVFKSSEGGLTAVD